MYAHPLDFDENALEAYYAKRDALTVNPAAIVICPNCCAELECFEETDRIDVIALTEPITCRQCAAIWDEGDTLIIANEGGF